MCDSRVLVVDDSHDSRKLMGHFLSKAGFQVDLATNGKEGIQKYISGSYNAILLDISMPEMDGMEAVRVIRKFEKDHQNPQIPIVALTAYRGQKVESECLQAGFSDFLSKPINYSQLGDYIIKLSEGKEIENELDSLQKVSSHFAPAERLSNDDIQKTAAEIEKNLFESSELEQIFSKLPEYFVILNEHRQVVYACRELLEVMDLDKSNIYGARPGEVFQCVNAEVVPAGCGTAESCSDCGAVLSILLAYAGDRNVKECEMFTKNGELIQMSVLSVPVTIYENDFVLFCLKDITDLKKRNVMERIFLHDIMNTASALTGYTSLLSEDFQLHNEGSEVASKIQPLVIQLVDEIRSQQELIAAEAGEIALSETEIQTVSFLKRIITNYSFHPYAKNKTLKLGEDAEDLRITCDERVLGRVLINMLKNALEASNDGDVITLNSQLEDNKICLRVHNPSVISHDIQRSLFVRPISSKGPGRGIGTYSMKLLTEKYLKGSVSFQSSEEEGTTFYCEIPLKRGE